MITNKQKSNRVKSSAFINPPSRIPFFLRIGIHISRKVTGKDLLVPKLMAWSSKVAISSGIMETLVAHGKKDLSKRMLKLVRVQTSLTVSCPFCIDMNSFGYQADGITDLEMDALAGKISIDKVESFTEKERIVLEYVKCLCATPIFIPKEVSDNLIRKFNEKEIVILASTVAQVNYWARLIQGLGVPPEGYMDQCDLPAKS